MPRQAIRIEVPGLHVDPDRALQPFEWQDLFGRTGPVEVEIGTGKARFLLAAAEARPEVLHFGVEWANQYLRIAEQRAERRGLTNVRFARVDARELVQRAIPTSSVRAYYVFYPDPWPKKRHHKRRFLIRSNVEHLGRTLVPGGGLHVATDHAGYWAAIEAVMAQDDRFERLPAFGGDDFPVPTDEPLTNFEAKYSVQGRERFRASWRRR